MGLLDRIAGTLDELTGEGRAAIADEIARARALADGGDPAAAESRLGEITTTAPDAAPAFLALGELRLRRGALEEAVAPLGRAVDLESGNPAAWCALGEALAGLGRNDPARDALRRTLALAIDAGLRRRATAALGQVHARAGNLTHAARELRKAIEMAPPGGAPVDERRLALDYGRVLARLGERQASEWLTRAARAENADAAVFAEAAAVAPDAARAEALLREGLGRVPSEVALRAALVRLLLDADRTVEAVALTESTTAEAPEDPRAWRSAREAATRTGRWRTALDAAARETALGEPPPPEARVALALGAEDRAALAALAEVEPTLSALTSFVAGRASEDDLLLLGRLAPNEASRRFVARAGAPPAPPAGQLAGLLAWAHDFASGTPALVGLATATGRAAEAFDRPLLIAVMGEFNAGKSSFVNALAGAEVAPTGVTPTTATINVLRYGTTPEARVLYHDGTTRAIAAADIAAFLASLRDADAREV
ncbi:MAG TPA: dynamin family protein, partial [Polyangia bacterium]